MSSLKFKHEEKDEDLMPKALDIPDDSSDEDSESSREKNPPMDGFAFLKSVMKERKRIADVHTAEIDPKKIKTPTCLNSFAGCGRVKPSVPDEFMPSAKWQNEQVSEFSDTRLKLTRHLKLVKAKQEFQPLKLPDKDNEMLWCLFCFGKGLWEEVESKRKSSEEGEGSPTMTDENVSESSDASDELKKEVLAKSETGTPPMISVLLSMPVHVVEQILEYQVNWVQATGWRSDYGPWLFALMSRIEKPLTPDTGSILRDLALFCSQERWRLVNTLASKSQSQEETTSTKQESEPDKGEKSKLPEDDTRKSGSDEDKKSAKDSDENCAISAEAEAQFAAYNLFICLVAKYFNQGDLADS
eukprot:TRINITY_DN1003_c0_g1_i1.p1 TRINITY_DN1003_c0_g1~~TRINITY_DN1003_c0_g1_i1.p1  ORF type:complete len:357 (-),score=80.86 TRINITY_DN1003_c0_g1_i1:175-1245(-)